MSETTSSTLFVADLPRLLTENDFIGLFGQTRGYVAGRLRQDKNEHLVGFVDYTDASSASAARDLLQSYKFPGVELPIVIHFSLKGEGSKPKKRHREDSMSSGSSSSSSFSLPPRADLFSFGAHPLAQSPAMFMPPGIDPYTAAYQAGPQGTYGMQGGMMPPIPLDASSTLYVEGLPMDATEREISHIFRPFQGFQGLRLMPKESRQFPTKSFLLCFVEFDNKYQATLAQTHLQGYRMDKHDTRGLKITFAKNDRGQRTGRTGPGGPPGSNSGLGPKYSRSSEEN